MRKRINKAIKHLGLEIAGGGKDGVFYFVNVETNTALDADLVYVSAMTHLSVGQWVKEAEIAQVADHICHTSKHQNN